MAGRFWKSNAEVLREAQEWYLAQNPSLPLPEQPQPEWQQLKQSWTASRDWLADTKHAPSPYYDWPPLGYLPPEFVIDEDGLVRLDRASPDG